MKRTYTDYFEIPVPLDVVCAALHTWETWQALPTGAERLGEMWRWGQELYTVQIDCRTDQAQRTRPQPAPATNGHTPHLPAGSSLTVQVSLHPVSPMGTPTTITLSLSDATIATHAMVQVSLDSRRFLWPWQRAMMTRTIATTVRACVLRLRALLRQQAVVPAPHEVCPLVAAASHAHHEIAAVAAQAMSSVPERQRAGYPQDTITSPDSLMAYVRTHYPRTMACFEQMGAYEHLEHVWRLEQRWQRMMRGDYDDSVYEQQGTASDSTIKRNGYRVNGTTPWGPATPASSTQRTLDYDLIYAGSGLGLLHAAVMSHCYGWRVMVFDRGEVGWAHREWNISRDELRALVDIGLVTWEELAPVIMHEYRTGLVSFHRGSYSAVPHSELWMPDVLSLAIDASGLLRLMRRKLEAAGSTVLDYRSFRCVRVQGGDPLCVEVVLEPAQRTADDGHTTTPAHPEEETYRARLLLDGMGSTSPLTLLRYRGQPFGGFCPTVGTVVRGFVPGNGPRECDPTIGDILISVADTQTDSQLIWEGFPGRDDEVTVYVFYYVANDSRLTDPDHPYAPTVGRRDTYSLLELFEHYLALLPDYKQPGPDFRHVKPVYGYIPGRHSVRPNEVPLLRGVLPIGDSAAQHSPLTYCGFGSHVRNLHRTTSLLHDALRHNLLEPAHLGQINAFQTNVSLNWVFSRFMQPWGHPHDVNELQNVFLKALNELGLPIAQRFFQDRMSWNDYNKIVGIILLRYPVIMIKALRVLQTDGILRWLHDYAHFTREALFAAGARAAGVRSEQLIYRASDCISPAAGLWIRARYAEWRAMRWV